MKQTRTLFLFDVDGTLTLPRQRIDASMLQFLNSLRRYVSIGFIGGSNIEKQKEQINDQILELFDYSFPENGLIFYRQEKKISEKTMVSHLGEDKLQKIINDSLKYLSQIKLPFKRGTFIELRTGLLNVSPPGRTCSLEERKKFFEFDKKSHIRRDYCTHMRKIHPDISFSIGGQISIDVFPNGWDKTYCLRHLVPRALEDYVKNINNSGIETEGQINKDSEKSLQSDTNHHKNDVRMDIKRNQAPFEERKDKNNHYGISQGNICSDNRPSSNTGDIPGIHSKDIDPKEINIEEKYMAENLTLNSATINNETLGTLESKENDPSSETPDSIYEIFFFGDMILPGQNDYELMVHPLVKGIGTKRPEQTREECLKILWEKGWAEKGMVIE